MDARERRIEEDIYKLSKLKLQHPDLRESFSAQDNPVTGIKLNLRVPTASGKEYPKKVQKMSSVQIDLSARYPLAEPKVSILSPVWNPNVYISGLVCLGRKWLPTEGLDLLVIRVMKLLAFDPLLLNTASPANSEAAKWYLDARSRYPAAFPTTTLDNLIQIQPRGQMQWRDLH